MHLRPTAQNLSAMPMPFSFRPFLPWRMTTVPLIVPCSVRSTPRSVICFLKSVALGLIGSDVSGSITKLGTLPLRQSSGWMCKLYFFGFSSTMLEPDGILVGEGDATCFAM